MIKRAVNIILSLVVASIVATGGVLPHHHHSDNSICFVTSQESDHTSGEHDTCPLEQKLVVSVAGSAHHHKCGVCSASDHDSNLHLPFAPLLATLVSNHYLVVLDGKEWRYKPNTQILINAARILYSPLRAPPVA